MTTADPSAQSKAAVPVRVALAIIRSEIGLQVRAKLNLQTVRDYAQKWRDGVKFPPVVLFRSKGELILIDGHHRCAAAAEARLKKIDATVMGGTLSQAVQAGIEFNARHGLRLTNRDKRASVNLALRHASDLSDGAIAALCGVSPRMVATHRGQAGANGADLKRVGRDGKCYPRKPRLSAQVVSPEQRGGRGHSVGIAASGADEHQISDFTDGIIKLRQIAHLLIERYPDFNGVVHHEFVALAHRTALNDCSMPPRTTDINDLEP